MRTRAARERASGTPLTASHSPAAGTSARLWRQGPLTLCRTASRASSNSTCPFTFVWGHTRVSQSCSCLAEYILKQRKYMST